MLSCTHSRERFPRVTLFTKCSVAALTFESCESSRRLKAGKWGTESLQAVLT